MEYEEWPDCPIEGCPNKICLALNSEFCFPHTPGNKQINGIKIDMRNAHLVPELSEEQSTVANVIRETV